MSGDPSVYRANLEALRDRSPEFAAAVDAAEALPCEPETARSGAITARMSGAYLHSRYDPAMEARRTAEESLAAGADCLVLAGLGLGYVAEAAMDSGAFVLAVEPSIGFFKAALSVRDMTGLFRSDRCCVILPTGDLAASIRDALGELSPRAVASLENPALMKAAPEETAALRAIVGRVREKDRINENTLKRFGKLWVRNLVRNLDRVAPTPGVCALPASFPGFPALVVSAGPSLDEVLPSLPAIAERCLVVCVDTALRSALRAGVEPDFVVVVDPQYWNSRHLDRCDSPGSVLVTEAAAWPSVLRFPASATFFCSSLYPLGAYLEERTGGRKGELGAGGSVSTTAWDFTRQLGCSPIHMAGLDLGFPGGKTHARASLFEQRALAHGRRLSPASMDSFLAFSGGYPFRLPSNSGGEVVTDKRLSLYSWWFQARLARIGAPPTYNLSKSGLAIGGMPYAPADSLLDLPPRRREISDVMSGIKALAAASGDRQGGRAEASIDARTALAADLDAMEGFADRGLRLVEGARKRGSGPGPEFDELSRLDMEILASSVKDVVGFLLPTLPELMGGRAKTIEESLGFSERLYRQVRASARHHRELLAAGYS